MQRQKTIAKWIAVILFITLAVGGYILFNTLYRGGQSSGDASADGGNDNPQNPPHIPYYTTLPREAEIFNNVKISHAGGEKNDLFENFIAVGDKVFYIFSSRSTEYDVKEPGLYLAVLKLNELISINKFAPVSETVLDIKLTANGIAVCAAGETYSKFYLFSHEGEQITSSTARKYNSASLYLWNKTLYCFAVADGFIYACTLDGELKPAGIEFKTECIGTEILEIIPKKDTLVLTANSLNNGSEILQFSPKEGFNRIKQFVNSILMQIEYSVYESVATFYTLLIKDGSVIIRSYDTSFNPLSEFIFNNCSDAVFFIFENDIRVLASNKNYRFCRHLDLLDTLPAEYEGNNLKPVRSSNDKFFSSCSSGVLSVYRFDAKAVQPLFTENKTSGFFKIVTANGKIIMGYSTDYNLDKAQMNFGGFDAFLAEIKL